MFFKPEDPEISRNEEPEDPLDDTEQLFSYNEDEERDENDESLNFDHGN